MVDLRGPNGVRGSFLLVAALIGALLVPTAVRGATGTTTTLEVPSGTQYGTFTVTAHVRPAPLSTNGFIPAVLGAIVGLAKKNAPNAPAPQPPPAATQTP